MAGAGDRAEPRDHLLVDEEHRCERQQEPDERGAVVLASLTVDGDAAGLVVADHDDDAGAHDREQGREPADPAPPRRGVVARNGPEAPFDVAAVGPVDRRAPLERPQKRADRDPAAALLGHAPPRHQGRPVGSLGGGAVASADAITPSPCRDPFARIAQSSACRRPASRVRGATPWPGTGIDCRQRLVRRPHEEDGHDRDETDQTEPEEHPLVPRGLRFEARLTPVGWPSLGARREASFRRARLQVAPTGAPYCENMSVRSSRSRPNTALTLARIRGPGETGRPCFELRVPEAFRIASVSRAPRRASGARTDSGEAPGRAAAVSPIAARSRGRVRAGPAPHCGAERGARPGAGAPRRARRRSRRPAGFLPAAP